MNLNAPRIIPISTPASHNDDIRQAHAALIARLASIRPPKLWLEPDVEDMEDYGTYMREVLERIKEFHGAVCAFVAMNGAGNLDELIGSFAAYVADAQSDFEGAMTAASEHRGEKL
jgi:hypothetical protein